jgi:hypothetical protein
MHYQKDTRYMAEQRPSKKIEMFGGYEGYARYLCILDYKKFHLPFDPEHDFKRNVIFFGYF